MFYVQEVRGEAAFLRGETAQHLRKVLRGEQGQRYEISDGSTRWLAELESFGKDQVQFRLLEELESTASPARIHLFPALIKFDHFEWMLEKLTELGVERVTPVCSLRCEKGLDLAAGKRMERWRRILHESGQQSRRLRPPELDEAIPLKAALAVESSLRLWLEEEGLALPLLATVPPGTSHAALLCGPEGGWDERERLDAGRAGWQAVSLGKQILRAETAAIAATAVLMARAAWEG